MSLREVEDLVNELAEDTELFSQLDAEIEKLFRPQHSRVGLTPEILPFVLADALSGKGLEPLNQQRKPKKMETIAAVFDVPLSSGRSHLIFQTDDGAFWQLCDVGLGWTAYYKVDSSWSAAKKFVGLLPVRVNPRPPTSAPWTGRVIFPARPRVSPSCPGEVQTALIAGFPDPVSAFLDSAGGSHSRP